MMARNSDSRRAARCLALAACVSCFFSLHGWAQPAADPRAPEAFGNPFDSEQVPAPAPAAGEAAPPAEPGPGEASPAPAAPETAPAPAETPATPETPAAEVAPETPAPEPSPTDTASMDKIRETNKALDAGQEEPSAPATASPVPEETSFVRQALNALWALLVVLALIFVVYVLARRLNRNVPRLGGNTLGRVLGRVTLDSRSMLHLVQVGEKVLAVGITQGHIALLGTFSTEDLGLAETAYSTVPDEEFPRRFLAQLQASGEPAGSSAAEVSDDAEITSLRNDIERLQRYLKEGPRAPNE